MTTYCFGDRCPYLNRVNRMCLWPRECPRGLDIASGLSGYHEPDKQKLLTKAEQWRKGEKQNELAKRSY